MGVNTVVLQQTLKRCWIKTDDVLIADPSHRNAPVTVVHQVIQSLLILGDVFDGVGNTFLRKPRFRLVATPSSRLGVDHNLFIGHVLHLLIVGSTHGFTL